MKLVSMMVFVALVIGAVPVTPALADDWRSLDQGIRPSERLVIGGQPTADLLREAAASGVQVVVNFRLPHEPDPGYDEAALAAALGLEYLEVPVASQGGLTARNLEAFDAMLAQVGAQSALMYCSSGNRIGAMFALHAARYRGLDTDAAVELGKAHGLTHFEDEVRAELEGEAQEPPQQ